MSASATGSRGVRRAPPEYVHPPPPVRPYTNVHQAEDIQLEERVKRGGRVETRPDLNSFTTKKSVSAGEQINSYLRVGELKKTHRSAKSWSLQLKFGSGEWF